MDVLFTACLLATSQMTGKDTISVIVLSSGNHHALMLKRGCRKTLVSHAPAWK